MSSPALYRVSGDERPTGPEPRLVERLERGDVLLFPPGALTLPPQEDLEYLRRELGAAIKLKNISYHPEGDYLSGIKRDPVRARRVRAVLFEHNREVQALLRGRLPEYAADWRVGKVNFRPLQERGRELPRHSSNELLHVDAFASGATHGDRVLRFFTNIHPTQSRLWKSAGLFPALFDEFREPAGIASIGESGLRPGLPERAFSGLLHAVARMGVAQPLAVDTSPYDRAMHRFHNYLKDDDTFQRDEGRCVRMEFPPFHSWAVLTDMVSHAAISGQHALVNTFYVKQSCCVHPELSPINIISGSAV